jgi:hypothetical protein
VLRGPVTVEAAAGDRWCLLGMLLYPVLQTVTGADCGPVGVGAAARDGVVRAEDPAPASAEEGAATVSSIGDNHWDRGHGDDD